MTDVIHRRAFLGGLLCAPALVKVHLLEFGVPRTWSEAGWWQRTEDTTGGGLLITIHAGHRRPPGPGWKPIEYVLGGWVEKGSQVPYIPIYLKNP